MSSKSNKKPSLPTKKLVTIGDAQVGKSSCLFRLSYDRMPYSDSSTIGAAFYSKEMCSYTLQMWDTAGQERFRAMIPMYLRGADIVLLVYDISNAKTFDHLKNYWVDFVLQFATKPKPLSESHTVSSPTITPQDSPTKDSPKIIIIANKSDLKAHRQVPNELGIELAKQFNAAFVELSALQGSNVNDLLQLIRQYLVNAKELDVDGDNSPPIILEREGWVSLAASSIMNAPSNAASKCNC